MDERRKQRKKEKHDYLFIGLIILMFITSGFTVYSYKKTGEDSLQKLTDNQDNINRMKEKIDTINYTNKDNKDYYEKITGAYKKVDDELREKKDLFDKYIDDAFAAEKDRKKMIVSIEKNIKKQKAPAGKEIQKNTNGLYILVKKMPTEEEAKKDFPEIWNEAVHIAGLVNNNNDSGLAYTIFKTLYDTDYPFADDGWPSEVIDKSDNTVVEIGTKLYDSIMNTNFYGENPSNKYAGASDYKAENYKLKKEQAEQDKKDRERQKKDEEIRRKKNTPPNVSDALNTFKSSEFYESDDNISDLGVGTNDMGGYRTFKIEQKNTTSSSDDKDNKIFKYARVYSDGTIQYSDGPFT
ncbi:hypothetical protein ACWOAH_06035 [Vagococcus vulneris]|uniref:Uncharacterized protein n=1 Tax=Vagococcus vulneris TaxID=1977869 RepID=A0A429ZZ67_9ENTE|nr:hypothetical protein [Vagococcus vulneris]RST99276.1 hypothetical protein CBF37_04720 [Vagococcus vulneris]